MTFRNSPFKKKEAMLTFGWILPPWSVAHHRKRIPGREKTKRITNNARCLKEREIYDYGGLKKGGQRCCKRMEWAFIFIFALAQEYR